MSQITATTASALIIGGTYYLGIANYGRRGPSRAQRPDRAPASATARWRAIPWAAACIATPARSPSRSPSTRKHFSIGVFMSNLTGAQIIVPNAVGISGAPKTQTTRSTSQWEFYLHTSSHISARNGGPRRQHRESSTARGTRSRRNTGGRPTLRPIVISAVCRRLIVRRAPTHPTLLRAAEPPLPVRLPS